MLNVQEIGCKYASGFISLIFFIYMTVVGFKKFLIPKKQIADQTIN
jgi:hypothetical protein